MQYLRSSDLPVEWMKKAEASHCFFDVSIKNMVGRVPDVGLQINEVATTYSR